MLIASRRHYLCCFERFAALRCGTARCLPLRLRLATTERRRIMPGPLVSLSRPQLIARISPNKTSHSLICETKRAAVKLLAVNKWNCAFAARIVLSECNSALLNGSARWISMFSPQLTESPIWGRHANALPFRARLIGLVQTPKPPLFVFLDFKYCAQVAAIAATEIGNSIPK